MPTFEVIAARRSRVSHDLLQTWMHSKRVHGSNYPDRVCMEPVPHAIVEAVRAQGTYCPRVQVLEYRVSMPKAIIAIPNAETLQTPYIGGTLYLGLYTCLHDPL